VTGDPEPIGAGRVLIEGGLDLAHDYQNTVSADWEPGQRADHRHQHRLELDRRVAD
jgi:hypothetical protein